MCGIGGIVRFGGERPDAAAIARMTVALRHRGPDDVGTLIDGSVGMAHTRLSVIDLSAAARQPMQLDSPKLSIVYNGEIYNHRELRRELEAHGRRFRTSSDTEVILHAYAVWGASCVEHLRGMFAFGLWDDAGERVLLARDRLGIKPLYYLSDGNDLLFGSEVKTILAYRGRAPELDPASLGAYFTFGFIPLSRTPFRGLAKLPAGHVLEGRRGTITTRRYWDLDFVPDEANRVEAPEEVLAAVDDAVRSHLVADVPIGAFLSGGLDSSAVVRLMRDAVDAPIKTFSVGFADRSYDERPYARAVAGALGTEHHEVVCTPDDFRSLWRTTVWHADGLAADISNVPLYLVARAAREHVPVVLSGDGGDELFGGYPTYQADRLATVYRHVPAPLRSMIGLVARTLPASSGKMSLDYRVKQFLDGAEATDAARAHFAWRRIFGAAERDAVLDPGFRATIPSHDTDEQLASLFHGAPATNDLHRAMYADVKTFLVDSILAKVDAMTMAHGLEARVPLLDHRLAELAARIPARLKLRFTQGKRILKDAMRGRLPAEVIRRTKSPFQPPLAGWLKSELRETVGDELGEGALARVGLFEVRRVEALKREHFAGTANHAFKLWNLLNFVEWHRLFVQGAWSDGASPGDVPAGRPPRGPVATHHCCSGCHRTD